MSRFLSRFRRPSRRQFAQLPTQPHLRRDIGLPPRDRASELILRQTRQLTW
jgi:hypothetical protein